jgi:uncharacterized protein
LIARHDLGTLPAVAWKNGGGATREIACRPAGASLDDFDWRVSVATIAADGAFSVFTGVDRWIALLRGGGVRLTGVGIDHRLDVPHAPFAFDGARALHAALVDGESADFNVMSRRARARARLRVIRAATRLDVARAGVVHAAAGTWTLAGDPRCDGDLVEGEGIGWDGEDGIVMRATPRTMAAVLYVVDFVAGNPTGAP